MGCHLRFRVRRHASGTERRHRALTLFPPDSAGGRGVGEGGSRSNNGVFGPERNSASAGPVVEPGQLVRTCVRVLTSRRTAIGTALNYRASWVDSRFSARLWVQSTAGPSRACEGACWSISGWVGGFGGGAVAGAWCRVGCPVAGGVLCAA